MPPSIPTVDLSTLAPFDVNGVLQVVIETPQGSRHKYAFDPERRVLMLKKSLPAGMAFPCDFGFVPCTRAGDGDPIDVVLFADEPTVAGCVVPARLIGVLEAEDTLPSGTTRRNDRLLAVALASHIFSRIEHVNELPSALVDQLREFFTAYPRILREKTYTILAVNGPDRARELVQQAQNNFAQQGTAAPKDSRTKTFAP